MAPDVEKRLRYFNGQFLQEKDFTDEQAYHIDRQRRHNRLLHTPGIAEGLDVEADVGARGAKVKPGTAVDAKGQFIVLAQERPVDFEEQHFGAHHKLKGGCKDDKENANQVADSIDSR